MAGLEAQLNQIADAQPVSDDEPAQGAVDDVMSEAEASRLGLSKLHASLGHRTRERDQAIAERDALAAQLAEYGSDSFAEPEPEPMKAKPNPVPSNPPDSDGDRRQEPAYTANDLAHVFDWRPT